MALMPQPRVVRYAMMDVFTKEPFMGNPLAVVLDGESLSQAEMLQIAKWMNLSETTFVVPVSSAGASADYRVRIFDPVKELMFAGHPTLGTCAALVTTGAIKSRTDGTVLQECGVGIVTVVVGDDTARPFEFRAPAVREPVQPLPQAAFLSVFGPDASSALPVITAPVVMNLGIRWGLIFFGDHNALLGLKVAGDELVRFCETHNLDGVTAVAAAATTSAEKQAGATHFDIELRTFFPSSNNTFAEDPVCGSANACVARFLAQHGDDLTGFGGLVQRGYVARQGSALGREGRVFVTYKPNKDTSVGGSDNTHMPDPWIGGFVCGVVQGTIRLS